MNIVLYKTNSEKNRLNKSLTNAYNINGHLKNTISIVNPVIALEYNANILGYNYCYIPVADRYYYINSISINNNTIELSMHVDVLMTFASSIKASVGTITRGNKGSKYLADPRIKNVAQHTLTHRRLGNGFTKADEYIVTIAGREVE